jgi:hypothetical protein
LIEEFVSRPDDPCCEHAAMASVLLRIAGQLEALAQDLYAHAHPPEFAPEQLEAEGGEH